MVILTFFITFFHRDINAAAEEYFSGGHAEKASSSKANPKALEELFNKYKDNQTNQMEGEGIAKFYEDVGIDAQQDTVALLISYYMAAKQMGIYEKEEFINGMNRLGCANIVDLKKKLP